MGGGRKSLLLAFFGFTRKPYQGEEEAEPRHQRPRKVRRSDEDDRGHWYAEPDIDRKAKEYIDENPQANAIGEERCGRVVCRS
ncbi:hypothetical protein MUK42_15771 [Musa troglodytarum]|uniref:Uncharacterized protein n=1 Tax=Musa troglodytarum TaxID=320322 RepID=A0A9E7HF50_9LILI|nr:hypothetical protein MUK42_15771 [Musa troglodytarum]